jgi:RNA polymerase sigma-70 factor (ECF subfamily)
MMPTIVTRQTAEQGGPSQAPSDEQVVARVRAGDVAAFEVILRRYNQRLFRAARAILRDDLEAEDVVQEAYVSAYAHLGDFAGRASFSTWLTKIVVHEAFARLRRRKRFQPMDPQDTLDSVPLDDARPDSASPERTAASRELAGIVEAVIDTLPEDYRVVFMLRAVEEMSVSETAACLDIPEDTVKTRLFRARGLLQEGLSARTEVALRQVHGFLGARCDGMVARVLSQLAQHRTPSGSD